MRAMTFEEWVKYTYGTTFVPPTKFDQYRREYAEYVAKFNTQGAAPDSPGIGFTDEEYPMNEPKDNPILPPLQPGQNGWFDQVLSGLMDNIRGTLQDPEKARALCALGLAAGSTWLLFYTDTAENLASQAGGIMQGIGSIPPENVNIEVGV